MSDGEAQSVCFVVTLYFNFKPFGEAKIAAWVWKLTLLVDCSILGGFVLDFPL